MRREWIAVAVSLMCGPAVAGDEFKMEVVDAFMITGRGVVLTGKIESGTVSPGDELCLVSAASGSERKVTVGGIEMFRKVLDSASAGQSVGLLMDGLKKGDAAKGDILQEKC